METSLRSLKGYWWYGINISLCSYKVIMTRVLFLEEEVSNSINEIRVTIQRLENNKAAGHDNLHAKLFKGEGDMLVGCIHHLIYGIWPTKSMRTDWNHNTLCPTNYRGISPTIFLRPHCMSDWNQSQNNWLNLQLSVCFHKIHQIFTPFWYSHRPGKDL